MPLKKHIPNIITALNLLSGSVAIILVLDGQRQFAALLIGLAALFDFFDGFAARLLHVKSETGKELDSLADVISFGLAPAIFLYALIQENLASAGTLNGWVALLPYLALLIAAFSAMRLAKFNLDTRQTDSFLGLPTPANALFIVTLSLITGKSALQDAGVMSEIAGNIWFQLMLIPVSCALLVSEIPLFSLKFSRGFTFRKNVLKYLIALIALALVLLTGWAAVPLIVLVYILLSVVAGKEKF